MSEPKKSIGELERLLDNAEREVLARKRTDSSYGPAVILRDLLRKNLEEARRESGNANVEYPDDADNSEEAEAQRFRATMADPRT